MLAMDPNEVRLWVAAYEKDQAFQTKYKIASADQEDWSTSQRYFKDTDGLLYFRDTNFHPRLCVPLEKRAELLTEAHESPFETAHAGPEKLWAYLSEDFTGHAWGRT